jgi:general secretion pathway protein G
MVPKEKRALNHSKSAIIAKGPIERAARTRGLTLIELLVVIFIIGILAVVANFAYAEFIYRSQISQAVADIHKIEAKLLTYYAENVSFPPTLAEVQEENRLDPWNRPYQYWPITGDKTQKVRKDRNLHPINTDFDLGSLGRDGGTNLALTAKASQDDIIRANNGAFVGLASRY